MTHLKGKYTGPAHAYLFYKKAIVALDAIARNQSYIKQKKEKKRK